VPLLHTSLQHTSFIEDLQPVNTSPLCTMPDWIHILSQAADPQGGFSELSFPIYKMTLIILPSQDAANLCFCFKGALGPLDEIHSSATISFFELLCHSILYYYDTCSSLYCKIFPWALLKNRCICDKRIFTGYLSDPLNFHGLCMGGDFFSALFCSGLQR